MTPEVDLLKLFSIEDLDLVFNFISVSVLLTEDRIGFSDL